MTPEPDRRAWIHRFLFPRPDRRFFLRFAIVVVAAYIVFGHLLVLMRIQGASMDPTYRDGGFTFCWRLMYRFSPPERGDVVAIALSGPSVLYLKRVVGIENDTVEFRSGTLFVNGREWTEPYMKHTYNWTWPERRIREGHVYVVGDNRNMPADEHEFGEVSLSHVAGAPLW